jgi:tRNA-Thr(GGU) m(6)t(6)A37 methyltransferase TsaA
MSTTATEPAFVLKPLGLVRNLDGNAWLEVDEPYGDAMQGLEQFSHIYVLYWFHENDTPVDRAVLRVHPCGNPQNPLTGVFATHSPLRPNLVALTRCRIRRIQGRRIYVDRIDARDKSPLIDIKSYFPPEDDGAVRTPNWFGRRTEEGKR